MLLAYLLVLLGSAAIVVQLAGVELGGLVTSGVMTIGAAAYIAAEIATPASVLTIGREGLVYNSADRFLRLSWSEVGAVSVNLPSSIFPSSGLWVRPRLTTSTVALGLTNDVLLAGPWRIKVVLARQLIEDAKRRWG